jgi:chaperonin GroEL (HSP60 family)
VTGNLLCLFLFLSFSQLYGRLRAVKNTMQDQFVCRGGGATEVALAQHLLQEAQNVKGRPRLGIFIVFI